MEVESVESVESVEFPKIIEEMDAGPLPRLITKGYPSGYCHVSGCPVSGFGTNRPLTPTSTPHS